MPGGAPQSRSWRITAPLRRAVATIRSLRRKRDGARGASPQPQAPTAVSAEPIDPDDHRRLTDAFHGLVYVLHDQTWAKTEWLGVRAKKLPLDFWVLQEIIFDTKPDLIVETGVDHGGSTLFFASLLDLIGGGEVIAIDVDLSHVSPRVREHPRVTLIEGQSTDDDVLAAVRSAARSRRVMVDLDSDHSADNVFAELEAYADLVTEGCYLVVEDTNLGGHPVGHAYGPGPMEALERWLAENPPFERDRSRERYLLTFNPGGYLRRVGPP